MERPRFNDHLGAIKFICKDFWSEIFKKQIDNLKTNHRGTFVFQDNKFWWLSRVSVGPSPEKETEDPSGPGEGKAAQAVSMYLYFPCGMIRGVLSNLCCLCRHIEPSHMLFRDTSQGLILPVSSLAS